MFGPRKIMKWFDRNLPEVRRSRRKTLAHIVAGVMKMKEVGVLALGRAMPFQAITVIRPNSGLKARGVSFGPNVVSG